MNIRRFASSTRTPAENVLPMSSLTEDCPVMDRNLVVHMYHCQADVRSVAHICDTGDMEKRSGPGRVQIEPGPWSLAVAEAMRELIDNRPGKRKRFQMEAGMSTRLAQLLNGRRAWYLEDVERACQVLGLDVIEFLESLHVATPKLQAVADDHHSYSVEDHDAAYDGGA